MKHKDLFSFYEDILREKSITPGKYDHFEILKDTPLKAGQQLEILCDKNQDAMVRVIELLVRLPIARMIDDYQKKKRRDVNKKISQDKSRKREQRLKKCYKAIETVGGIDSNIDKEMLRAKANNKCNFSLSEYGLLPKVLKAAPAPGKRSLFLSSLICEIYRISKTSTDHSDNLIFLTIAKLLDSLRIRKSNESIYRRQDIYGLVNRMTKNPPLLYSKNHTP